MVGGVKKVKTYADAEALHTLDGACSVTTLHAHNDNRAAAAKKWKGEEIVEVNTSDSELLSSSIETKSDDDVSVDSASTKNLATPKEQARQTIGPVHG